MRDLTAECGVAGDVEQACSGSARTRVDLI